jgi:hypothetical protein
MRPFAVPDKWFELTNPPFDALNSSFDGWVMSGRGAGARFGPPSDNYVPTTGNSLGSGYTVAPAAQGGDLGRLVTLKGGNSPDSNLGAVTPGWFLPLQLPDPTSPNGWSSGANETRAQINTCIGRPVSIGQYIPTATGAMVGPIGQGVADLIAMDPSATWNTSTNSVANTCAPACAPFSPRIVPITVFDLDEFQWRKATNDWTWGSAASAIRSTVTPGG